MRTISHDILEKCYHQGALAYPEETCGFISGKMTEENHMDAVHPMPNMMNACHEQDPQKYPRTNRNAYLIDPLAQMRLEQTLAQKQHCIRVIYHSHPEAGAYFSAQDESDALWNGQPRLRGVHYLVCGIKQHQPNGAILATFNPNTEKFDLFPLDEPCSPA